jgi:protein disulfide-isomerase A1
MRASVPSIVVYKPYDERKATISDNFEESFIQ